MKRIALAIATAGLTLLALAPAANAQQVTLDMLRTRIRQFETCLVSAMSGDAVKIVVENVRQDDDGIVVFGSFSKQKSLGGMLGNAIGKGIVDGLTGEKSTIYNNDLLDFEETDRMIMAMGGSVILGEFNISYVVLATPRHQYDTRRPDNISARKVAKCL